MFTTLTSYKIVSKTLSEICRSCDFIKSRTIIRVSTYTNGNLWLSKLISGAMRGIQTSKMSTALSLRCALSKYKLYYFSWLCSRNKEDDELKNELRNEWWEMSVSGHPATLGRFKQRETQVKWQVFISLVKVLDRFKKKVCFFFCNGGKTIKLLELALE